MSRLIGLLGLGLLAAAAPQFAAAQEITLDPGLYDFSMVVTAGGGVQLLADESQYCVVEGDNTKSFDELAAGIPGNGQCEITNINMTESTGSADFACTETAMGIDLAGTMEATFGPDFYDVETKATIPFMGEILAKTDIRRVSECPVDWVNP